jgi:two-component system OmpR family response regulator
MSAVARVLVVDDEPEICDLIRDYLTEEGYSVGTAGDGESMRRALDAEPADIVLLDLRLPGEDGFALAGELRRVSDAGIIVVSGKDDVVDRVAALETGADDFITKPFHLRELLARLRSVLRRRSGHPDHADSDADGAEPPRDVRRFAGWLLDLDGRSLKTKEGGDVKLTASEFNLLVAFLDHPNRVLTRNRLLDLLHDREGTPFDRSIDMQVRRLRRKIETDPRRPALIKTIHGAGYKFEGTVLRA